MPNSDERKFKVYLSHSWRPHDVELNLRVWKLLSDRCDLLVDRPESQEENPPYYVNRLEELMRRCDLFVAILTYRENENVENATGDYALKCSAGSLFEIRLAERSRRPRLVLYERDTDFRRPEVVWRDEKYIAFDRGTLDLPDGLDGIESEVGGWLDYIYGSQKPRISQRLDHSVVLLPDSVSSDTATRLDSALEAGSFPIPDIDRIRFEKGTDAKLVHRMFNAGLVVADVASNDTRELYAIAHTLFVPTIRMAPDNDSSIFWILDGHPGGYQWDIVRLSEATWPKDVTARARAIFQVTEPLALDAGCQYIKSRRYKGTYVFISHNLKPGKREFLDQLVGKLKDAQIDYFEYYRVNTAGIDWAKKLADVLQKTKIFVGLLADGYEDSDVCLDEWDAVKDRVESRKVMLLPFLVNGRTTRTNLTRLHNETLDCSDPEKAAETIFIRIKSAIAAAVA